MKRIALSILILALLLAGCAGPAAAEVVVTIPDIGKADAILITGDDWSLLIDTGKDKHGAEILALCEKMGVKALDALLITHYDKDHVGGADAILANLPVETVYEPGYAKDSKQYRQFVAALAASDAETVVVNEDRTFTLGEASFTILTPHENYEQENDLSLVVRMVYGQTSFLFAADAEKPRLRELLSGAELRSDFLKVPHHGGAEDLSATFFAAVGARCAVITSEDDEPESAAVLEALAACGTEVFLTRLNPVRAVSDGEAVTVAYTSAED